MTYLTSKKETRFDEQFLKALSELDKKFWDTICFEEKLHHINTRTKDAGTNDGN